MTTEKIIKGVIIKERREPIFFFFTFRRSMKVLYYIQGSEKYVKNLVTHFNSFVDRKTEKYYFAENCFDTLDSVPYALRLLDKDPEEFHRDDKKRR